MRFVIRAARWVLIASLGAMLLAPILMQIAPSHRVIVVQGASMQPHLHIGDIIVVDRNAPIDINDVVTARRPDGSFVTHRVVDFDADDAVILRGDANPVADPRSLARSDIIGVVSTVISSPWSTIIRAATSTVGRLVLVAALMLLIAGPTFLRRSLPLDGASPATRRQGA